MAKELGLQTGKFDIRINMGGDAVHGETILHTEDKYVLFTANALLHSGFCAMARNCSGRKDYCGKTNNWFYYKDLHDLKEFAAKIKNLKD